VTRDETAAWVARRHDSMNRHDVAALTALYAADCAIDSPTAGRTVRGTAAIEEIYRACTPR
jgi:ketosteroid isomerase-like protein